MDDVLRGLSNSHLNCHLALKSGAARKRKVRAGPGHAESVMISRPVMLNKMIAPGASQLTPPF
jgi:hypothetical protein